ncbi:MAG TPA: hypothetical protein VGC28_02085, partial [Sphingomonas sp.]
MAVVSTAPVHGQSAVPSAGGVQAGRSSRDILRFPGDGDGAYRTHRYHDLFEERLGRSSAESRAKIDKAFQQL